MGTFVLCTKTNFENTYLNPLLITYVVKIDLGPF